MREGRHAKACFPEKPLKSDFISLGLYFLAVLTKKKKVNILCDIRRFKLKLG